MNSKAEILEQLRSIFEELFEIEPEKVQLQANLYTDLDIDSIDAVDLVVRLKEITGKKIEPDEFKNVRTVDDVVEAVHGLVQA